ncbi:conserved hypothetical protein [Thermobifida fusca YX]|nr:conserved hypothetical protein [Thermobifida fusca YX]
MGLTVKRRSGPGIGAGPSPRAWGSPRNAGRAERGTRSIPTCVGLMPGTKRPRASRPVHPHVRGAHYDMPNPPLDDVGPSPRAWGSLVGDDVFSVACRSIPTCVGLTFRGYVDAFKAAVHPHVRGAHRLDVIGEVHRGGPSPRAWGSRPRRESSPARVRSIPTCVGLTRSSPRSTATGSVHPHVRGAHSYLPATLQGVIFSLPPFRDRRHLLFRTFRRR